MFVAADPLAGNPVVVAQPVDPAPNQDGVHGRGGQVQPVGDLDRAQALAPAQGHDVLHHRGGGAVRAGVRPAGVIVHSRRAVLAVAQFPPSGGGPRNHEQLGCGGDAPSVLDDEPG